MFDFSFELLFGRAGEFNEIDGRLFLFLLRTLRLVDGDTTLFGLGRMGILFEGKAIRNADVSEGPDGVLGLDGFAFLLALKSSRDVVDKIPDEVLGLDRFGFLLAERSSRDVDAEVLGLDRLAGRSRREFDGEAPAEAIRFVRLLCLEAFTSTRVDGDVAAEMLGRLIDVTDAIFGTVEANVR